MASLSDVEEVGEEWIMYKRKTEVSCTKSNHISQFLFVLNSIWKRFDFTEALQLLMWPECPWTPERYCNQEPCGSRQKMAAFGNSCLVVFTANSTITPPLFLSTIPLFCFTNDQMAPAKYTRDFFNNNALFRQEWDEAVNDSEEIPVHLLPRMKLLQMIPWRTSAVNSGDTMLEWIVKHANLEGFTPGMNLLSVRATQDTRCAFTQTHYFWWNVACWGILRP